MTKRPTLTTPSYFNEFDAEVSAWLIRIVLSNSIALKQLINGIYAEEFRAMIGIVPSEGKISMQSFIELEDALLSRANEIKCKLKSTQPKCVLDVNLNNLTSVLSLSQTQQDILKFLITSQHHILFRDLIDQLNINTPDEMVRVLSKAFMCPESEVNQAIYENVNGLITRKLITLSMNYLHESAKFKVNSDIYKVMFVQHDNLNAMLDSFVDVANPSALDEDDFRHLCEETEVLSAYFQNANKHNIGVNVMIYGPTGTGKTEYVKWLSEQMGKSLYLVKSQDADNASVTGTGRLAFYQLSQQFLKHADAIILFDEIEDIFPTQDSRDWHSEHIVSKAWLNHLLESNPVPTIWVSNAIDQIDKAYLRRFDFSIEIGIPSLGVRKRILQKYLSPLQIADETIARYAQQAWLSPAQIERAAHVLTRSNTPLNLREHNLNLILGSSMKLLNQKEITAKTVQENNNFELDYINADHDLAKLITTLKSKPNISANICLHGEPGNGKTSFAHFIANQLNRPLISKSAAELLSPYLGETEQNMLQAFKMAEEENAVLLIDEADSFISSRAGAARQWEVTQINQMLSLMESFQGLLICSTNRLEQLDEASLRRFTFKIRFDVMTAEQRWLVFKDMFKENSNEELIEYKSALFQLNGLSLGDFSTVKKQALFATEPFKPADWIRKLKAEIQYKYLHHKSSIGFI